MNIIKKIADPIDNEAIEKFEKILGSSLPPDYREFLLSSNGGVPEKPVFRYLESGPYGESMVRHFFGLTEKTDKSLSYKHEIYVSAKRMLGNMLPIACDPGGNIIVISVSGDDKGSIYFWDHEQEGAGASPSYENLSLVSKSFSSFIDALEEETY